MAGMAEDALTYRGLKCDPKLVYPGHGAELFAKAIREELDSEDWENDPENEDQQVRRIYLGSVFTLTPSGKFYLPFACSNVAGCDACKGTGSVPRHRRRRVAKRWVTRALRIRERHAARAKQNEASARAWVAGRDAWRWQYGRSCTACGGLGSREAHLDDVWRDYAEAVCASVGATLTSGDGSGDDLFIEEYREREPEEEEPEGLPDPATVDNALDGGDR